ncbi:MAG TPA: hypothetical protein VKI61_18230 [Chitinophagaceae bacterium]|jgi:hypothetical protein|nr:hypothetical protein [Chitinophagaceae bacterium]
MKQKMIYLVFLVMAMNFPASSKECAKISKCRSVKAVLEVQKKAAAVEISEETALPASPFSAVHLNM